MQVGVVKSVEKKQSVAGHFALKDKSETYWWTKKLNNGDYGEPADVHKDDCVQESEANADDGVEGERW